MKKAIEILQHRIAYEYENNQTMPEHEEEHIKNMIIGGYNSGELCCTTEADEEVSGWWSIVK